MLNELVDICDCQNPDCTYGGIEHLIINALDKKDYSLDNNLCQICNKNKKVTLKSDLVISCKGCKSGVAMFEFNLAYLHKALAYLCKTPKTQIYSYSFNLKEKQKIYDDLLHEQAGRCAICNIWWKDSTKKFHIDHDHIVGKIRGLLCYRCNISLGQFNDSPEAIANAVLNFDSFIDQD